MSLPACKRVSDLGNKLSVYNLPGTCRCKTVLSFLKSAVSSTSMNSKRTSGTCILQFKMAPKQHFLDTDDVHVCVRGTRL